MGKKGDIHFSPAQFWGLTFLVVVLCLFVGLMCGLTPACVPPEAQSDVSARNAGQERNRRDTPPYENLRLPESIQPIHYTLELDPDLSGATDNFTGSVDIEVEVTEPTPYPRVHIKEMTILSARITKDDDTEVPIMDEFFYAENEFYVLDVGGDLEVGTYTISLTFTGSLVGHIVGFYKSTYTTPDGDVR